MQNHLPGAVGGSIEFEDWSRHPAAKPWSAALDALMIDPDASGVPSTLGRVSLSEVRADRKNEAGAIAGVVFEDTVRRISRKHQISEKGRSLEDLLNDLNKANVLTGTKTKRAKSAAHVRTKATHAQWDEFDMNDVRITIELTGKIPPDQCPLTGLRADQRTPPRQGSRRSTRKRIVAPLRLTQI